MKKSLALLLSAVMLTAVLAACAPAQHGENTGGPATGTTGTTDTTGGSPEPTVVKWVGSGMKANGVADKLIERYSKVNPDVTVEYNELSNLIDTKFWQLYDTMIASGEQVDLIYMNTLSDIIVRARSEALLPLDSFISDNGDDFVKDYTELAVQMLTLDDKVFGIPYSYSTFKVFYNKTMFSEKGITVPENWTWDDFKAIAVQLNDPANKFYGCFFPITWTELTYAPAQSAGWKMVDSKDGQIVAGFEDPLFRQNMEMLYDFSMVSKLMPDLATAKAEQLNRRVALAEKRTAMTVDSYYTFNYLHGYQFDSPGNPLDFEIGVMDLPRWDSSSPADVGYSYMAGAYVIPKTSEAPLEAYKFARFICNDNVDLVGGVPAYAGANIDDAMDVYTTYTDKTGVKHENIYKAENVLQALTLKPKSHLSYYHFDPMIMAQYGSVLEQLYSEQYELYFTGQVDLDGFIKTMQTRATEEIARIQ